MESPKLHAKESEKTTAATTATNTMTTTAAKIKRELMKKNTTASSFASSTPTTPESIIDDEPDDGDELLDDHEEDEKFGVSGENESVDMSANANLTNGIARVVNNNNNNGADAAAAAAAAAASVAAIAAALDLKPKFELLQAAAAHQQQQQQKQQQHHHHQRLHRHHHHNNNHHGAPQQQQQQKIKKLVRRNASDKLKLIQMVHDNPILWDSRLPNFKGAEEEKNRAWEQIGKEFNAPGRRVARAFKSLRESYRRELAHVKLMGSGFKPKWSLYDAMDFLRDVIRERKGGSAANLHVNETAAAAATMIGLNLRAFSHINHNNNNNNNSNTNNHNNKSLTLKQQLNGALHSSTFNESASSAAALNLTKCAASTLNLSNGGAAESGVATTLHDDYYYFVKPEAQLSANANASIEHQQNNGHHMQHHKVGAQQQQQHQHHNGNTQSIPNAHQNHANSLNTVAAAAAAIHYDSRVTSTRSDSSVQNMTAYDDMDAASMRSVDEASLGRNAANDSDEVEELDAIDADFPYPLILGSHSPANAMDGGGGGLLKRKRKNDNEDDEYEGQMLQQHRLLRQQNVGCGGGGNFLGVANGSLDAANLDIPPPQTVREVLNSKFCGFISAKLNSMKDIEADNLMNRILMLLVQTQSNAAGIEGK